MLFNNLAVFNPVCHFLTWFGFFLKGCLAALGIKHVTMVVQLHQLERLTS